LITMKPKLGCFPSDNKDTFIIINESFIKIHNGLVFIGNGIWSRLTDVFGSGP